ncbi:hypothetical protein [Exiguobacterium sp. s133]|uniref:hypothetical protein n=1 Tax=Exiguobacterium sp. s133 TaxID=2751213 RepID=UPI001BEAEC21|nr:hypothetical protein [Exiguobacterium sp. s133]
MKKATLKSSIMTTEGFKEVQVDGWLLELNKDLEVNDITNKYSFGIYKKDDKRYYVIENETGSSISNHETRKGSVAAANNVLSRVTLEKFETVVDRTKEKFENLKLKRN